MSAEQSEHRVEDDDVYYDLALLCYSRVFPCYQRIRQDCEPDLDLDRLSEVSAGISPIQDSSRLTMSVKHSQESLLWEDFWRQEVKGLSPWLVVSAEATISPLANTDTDRKGGRRIPHHAPTILAVGGVTAHRQRGPQTEQDTLPALNETRSSIRGKHKPQQISIL
ncbi:hypothetical protein THAOC_33229 [Thalassiosira oceanica]|uniref:Uncharacterized protein n=1 Tax=Thalassiosira oceanica TaxID=159749 RepID=K0R5J2_THAOC|nr:hypothetical protein THAOC_33229 [Thalassiosira oceanica]|eukprot:EJK48010.1 hypothetical protein THAOC_33229 [Thalassiosira oceanica]